MKYDKGFAEYAGPSQHFFTPLESNRQIQNRHKIQRVFRIE